jgi:hypothetical protein
MLEKARPDVVHVTPPPISHFGLAMDSFDAGAHVIVEKPATSTFEELEMLVGRAQEAGRHLVEDHNYVFNHAPQEILRRMRCSFASTFSARAASPIPTRRTRRSHSGRRRHRRLPAPPSVAGAPLRWSAPDCPDGLDQAQALAPAVRGDVGSYEKWGRRQFEYGKIAVQVWDKLGKDPMLHPLRNLVNGNPANRAAVYLLSRNAMTTRAGTELLRAIGGVLKKAGVFWPALATYKAILAIQYHAGVKEALGSWSALRESEKAFMRDPRRPLEPMRRGKTYSRDSSSSDHT